MVENKKKRFHVFAFVGLVLGLGLLILTGGVSGATNVSSCQTISTNGTYVLNKSLSQTATCITIAASNVTFDGAGYSITGTGSNYGVYVYTGSALTNVTVKNLNVSDWFWGIYYDSASSGRIENNTANSNQYGIQLVSSNNNILTNNTASPNDVTGIYIKLSSGNNLTDNNASSNNNGIYFESSDSNIISNNTVSSNSVSGISIDSGSGSNSIYNNIFNNSINVNIANTNTWNTTKQSGTNIIGGPNLGGNFWAYPNGTGFSETCADAEPDGICDSNNTLASGNVDYLPLTVYTPVHNLNTSLNYSTIQAAIDAAATLAGHTISLDAVTFTENVDVTKAVIIVGAGAGSTIVQAAVTTDHVFNVTNVNNVNISGLTVTGATDAGKAGIYRSNSNYSKIESVNASNNIYGIYLITSSNNILTNNTANSNTQHGIYLYLSSNNNILTNNTASSNSQYGILLDTSSNNNTLTNNTANSNTQHGIYLYLSSNNNILTNNTANSNTQYGIYLSSSSNNNITDNTASSNTGHGIYLSLSSNNNILTNNTASSNSQNGILLGASSNNNIKNNTVDSNGYHGILMNGNNNNIANNLFRNHTGQDELTNCKNDSGICIAAGSQNNLIIGNTFTLNTYGVYSVATGQNNNIRFNNIAATPTA